ncbi:hypothetical protein CDIK_1174 [Cucumispora dikerogammari]|nr:hypothetical protein CDIK_1174 [Cucumispora dikerogammari]
MLELICCKRETVLDVLVMVKNIREEELSITEESISLIRCTEHIGMNRYNYDYEIKFDKYRNFYYLKSEEFKIGTYSSEDPAMRGRIKTNLTAISMKHPLFVAESTEEYTEGWTQSKSISEFRKAVGIAGDAIRNTKLKFRVVLEVLNRRSDSFLTITVETKPFSFFENEDGTLALNKEIGLKRCLKNFIT